MTPARATLAAILVLAAREAAAQSPSGTASSTPVSCNAAGTITFTITGALNSAYNGAVFTPAAAATAAYDNFVPGSPVWSANVSALGGMRYLFFMVRARRWCGRG